MLPTLKTPELVFGLCAPIGTDTAKIGESLRSALLRYEYNSERFKVTDLMKAIKINDMTFVENPADRRYDSYINYANKLRELFEDSGVLAMMCCAAVRAHRRKNGKEDDYVPKQAYIFDQFKRPEEIDVLRQAYGRIFVLISIYSSSDHRHTNLLNRLASDNAVSRPSLDHDKIVKELMARDEDEESHLHGQRLREIFPMADLFVNVDDIDASEKTIARFLQAFFGSNKVSPTPDEYGMYIAKGASFRSVDLSRQVGAAIFSDAREVISLGCNEVPKPGGGTYWCVDPDDARDYTWGHDENERIKRSILADLVRRLAKANLIPGAENFEPKDVESLVTSVLDASYQKGNPVRESHLMDLLEFGRAIHAEMSAITDAARTGRSLRGTHMYCTTFPCHMCAKHIVSSGITELKYIEPYPKSYAEQLHSDSIYVGVKHCGEKRTVFSPFIGISPHRFRDLFERGKRKDHKGTFSDWIHGSPHLIVSYTIATYLKNEEAFIKDFKDKADALAKAEKLSTAVEPPQEAPKQS